MQHTLLSIQDVSVQTNGLAILKKINLRIENGQQWAITGASGAGKTTLAHAIMGRIFFTGSIEFYIKTDHRGGILLVDQQHHFKNLSNTSNFYYQQRFNSADAEDSLTVAQYLQQYLDTDAAASLLLIRQLHLSDLLDEPLIQLSNGENKRLQLAAALLKKPAILIMDNPFLGLDTEGRATLHQIIDSIIRQGTHVILITHPGELPESITHVAVMNGGELVYCGHKEAHKNISIQETAPAVPAIHIPSDAIPPPAEEIFSFAIRMKDVSVRYGDKLILDKINWEVKKGERWSISGPNGAGKSTLLSLVSADNPQAYANEIYLFDQKRGTGESIWDIKKRIGFVSPELHLFFDRSNTVFEVLASGLFDTIGLFRQLSEAQIEQINKLLNIFGISTLRQTLFFRLSLGQQRMALLARALIKNPTMLILDEPCQGLDEIQSLSIKNLIDQSCAGNDRTVLYISHYEKDIPAVVTSFLWLDKGKASFSKNRG